MPKKQNGDAMTTQTSAVGTPITSADEAQQILKSRADLSYHFFEGVKLDNIVARQSLFHGVLFRNCTIVDSDFSRSDFEGARFEDCALTNVSFETADVRSTKFSVTKLFRCTFRSAFCSDNFFIGSIINECEFEDGSVFRCNFSDCTVNGIKNRTATWLHNTFTECSLNDFAFVDCTSSYTIYNKCMFNNVTINADALGLTFGISEENLKAISFGFLGQTYGAGVSPGVEAFLEQYRNRNWRIHSLVLALNFKSNNANTILFSIIREMAAQIDNGIGAKRDDLEFIFRIFSQLESSQRLPFSAAIYAYDTFAELMPKSEGRPVEEKLAEFGWQKSTYIVNSMDKKLHSALLGFLESDIQSKVEARITYVQKPDVETSGYINTVAQIVRPESSHALLIDAHKGSWIEIIHLSIESLVGFYVALYLVNGCLAQLTMVRARSKALLSKRVPAKFLEAAVDPTFGKSKKYDNILRKLISSQLSGDPISIKALAALSREDVDGMIIEVKEISS